MKILLNKKIGTEKQLLFIVVVFILGISIGVTLTIKAFTLDWIDIKNVFSTFIGALFAFILSFLSFHANEEYKDGKLKKRLTNCVKKELAYNRQLLSSLIISIEQFEEGIKNKKNVTTTFNYSYYQRLFITEYFRAGYMWDKLDNNNIHSIEQVLTLMNPNVGTALYNHLLKWNKSKFNFNKNNVLADLSTAKITLKTIISYIDILVPIFEK